MLKQPYTPTGAEYHYRDPDDYSYRIVYVVTPQWALRIRRVAEAVVSWTRRFDTYDNKRRLQ
jgi:hypothetical protein